MVRKVKIVCIYALVASALSVIFVFGAQNRPGEYERMLIVSAAEENGSTVSKELLTDASPEQLALVGYGPVAFRDAKYFPETAMIMWPMFGHVQEFRVATEFYGPKVIIVMKYHYDNETTIQVMKRKITTVAQGEDMELTPEVRAYLALERISVEGHEFLSGFTTDAAENVEVVASVVVPNAVQRFLLSGIQSVETKLKSGLRPTAGEYLSATLDAAVILSPLAIKTFKMLKGTKAAVSGMKAGTRLHHLRLRTAFFASRKIAKWTAYGSLIGGTYLAIAHPRIFHAGVAAVARAVGVPTFLIPVIQVIAWFIPFVIIFGMIRFLCSPIILLSRPIRPIIRHLVNSGKRCMIYADRRLESAIP